MLDRQANRLQEERAAFTIANRSPYLMWLIWVVWLPLSVPAFIAFFQAHPAPLHLIATLIAVVLFFATYLWSSWIRAYILVREPARPQYKEPLTWLTIIALNLLCLCLALLGGNEWQTLFFYASGYVGGILPLRWAIPVASMMALLAVLIGLPSGLGWFNLVQAVVFIPAIVFITRSVLWSITTSWELSTAREEIARLAVVTERLRIARDLHDLLGHNLSLITIKSELAGRLISVAPERAATEISDVEQVARTTLQEVREAVGNYRQPGLSSELHAARELLAAAGITCQSNSDQEEAMNGLTTPVEAVLAWTVREGVTNIIRHSHAHHCAIHLTKERHTASIEILDDGTGNLLISTPGSSNPGSTNKNNSEGHGLRGLAERVKALGGQFDAGPNSSGGFRLTVLLPLSQKALRPDASIHNASSMNERFPQARGI